MFRFRIQVCACLVLLDSRCPCEQRPPATSVNPIVPPVIEFSSIAYDERGNSSERYR
jgi:hypothetical protein